MYSQTWHSSPSQSCSVSIAINAAEAKADTTNSAQSTVEITNIFLLYIELNIFISIPIYPINNSPGVARLLCSYKPFQTALNCIQAKMTCQCVLFHTIPYHLSSMLRSRGNCLKVVNPLFRALPYLLILQKLFPMA